MKENIIPIAIPNDIIIPIPKSPFTPKKSFSISINTPDNIENINPKINGSFSGNLKKYIKYTPIPIPPYEA